MLSCEKIRLVGKIISLLWIKIKSEQNLDRADVSIWLCHGYIPSLILKLLFK